MVVNRNKGKASLFEKICAHQLCYNLVQNLLVLQSSTQSTCTRI